MRYSLVLAATAALFTVSCASKNKNEIPAAAQPAVAPVATDGHAATPAVPAVSADGLSRVECVNKKDQRILEIRSKGAGCELAYTKAGQAAVVASGTKGTTRCASTMKKIQGKLAASGYVCK